jgi:N-acetylneuraminate 9-O-acetyltransferase
MAHTYTPKDATSCLSSRRVFFIGDSVTRKLFFQFAHIADPSLPLSPPDDEHKHSDHELSSKGDIQFSFHWDPFLNSSVTRTAISFTSWPPAHSPTKPFERKRPALLVLGSGLWYLRYSDSSGGLPRWEATIEATLDSITNTSSRAADEIVLLPVEEVVSSKLSRDRASTMRSSDIDAMNSDLLHRVASQSAKYVPFLSASHPPAPVSYAKVFNEMLDVSQTEDGLHYSDAIVRAQANVLLNLRCNDVLPKTFPFDKTCCRSYPRPSALHMAVIVFTVLWGPLVWILSQRQGLFDVFTLHGRRS